VDRLLRADERTRMRRRHAKPEPIDVTYGNPNRNAVEYAITGTIQYADGQPEPYTAGDPLAVALLRAS
jgi:hypothetical protein